MNLKAIAAVGLIAVGVGAVGVTVVGLPGGSEQAVTYRTATAAVTDVQQTAASSGSLVAATVYELAFGETPVAIDGTSTSSTSSTTSTATAASTGSTAASASTGATGSTATVDVTWPVTAVNVEVGDLVKAGAVLAVADDTSAELAVRQAEANLAAAKTQRKVDLAGGTATSRASAKDQVTQASQSLSQARSSYSSTVAQNNLKVKQAQQALSAARKQYTRDKAAGAPAATLSQDKAAITQAQQSLASTRLQVAAGNRQAANQIASAKLSLKSAQRNYRTATTSADDATIVADDVAIAEAEQALADAQAALELATITAPIDGRITAVNAVVGEDSTGTAIELQSTRLATTLAVTEDDILSLAIGQPATVDISATGETATGTVTAIDPVASTSGSSSAVSYSVVVTLDEATGETAAGAGATTGAGTTATTAAASPAATTTASQPLPGMSAEVTIVTAEAPGVISVPAIAVSGTAGNYTVRVLAADGSVESRAVEVGLIASDYAQITSGIAEGETVVTGSSADRTTTTTTTTSSGRDGFGGMGGLSGAGGMPAGGPPAMPGGQ